MASPPVDSTRPSGEYAVEDETTSTAAGEFTRINSLDSNETSTAETSTTTAAPSAPDATKKNDTASTKEPLADGASENSTQQPTKKDKEWLPPDCEPHPDTEEILRQVEFYFSDENLPQDAHLLSLTGEFGDGWVSINEILSWKKMRKYKPPLKVKASLHKSTKLLVWKNKVIRRKDPLQVPLTVEPKANPKREQAAKLIEKPWLTKGILKPTGFEKTFAEPPMAPDEAEEERKLFDPEESFVMRIEHAVARYQQRRKMHQKTRHIFTKFLTYGGFKTGPNMFGGGFDAKEMEDYDKDEIALIKSDFAVSDLVLDGIYEEDPSWVVDFETYAKAFFSCEFMASAVDWKDTQEVGDAANIIRNFYNYLLHHDVCPEYAEQVHKAKAVCDLAEEDLSKLARFDNGLNSRGFNAACSTLHGGHWKEAQPWDTNAEWINENDTNFMSDVEACVAFMAGVQAHCGEQEIAAITTAFEKKKPLATISSEEMGLEVVSVELPSEGAKTTTIEATSEQILVRPVGKLHCIRWRLPNTEPKDLPKAVLKEQKAKIGEKHVFLMEEDTLLARVPGMKFEATVRKLETGLEWIDSVTFTYPSFYTYTLNERMQYYKPPGPPKPWMKRAMAKERGEGQEIARAEDLAADSTPD